jgi:hypothetical protein
VQRDQQQPCPPAAAREQAVVLTLFVLAGWVVGSVLFALAIGPVLNRNQKNYPQRKD